LGGETLFLGRDLGTWNENEKGFGAKKSIFKMDGSLLRRSREAGKGNAVHAIFRVTASLCHAGKEIFLHLKTNKERIIYEPFDFNGRA
jgi:hypothetical protein